MVKFPLTVNDDKNWTFDTVRKALKGPNSLPFLRYLFKAEDVEKFGRLTKRLLELVYLNKIDPPDKFKTLRPSPTRKLIKTSEREQWERRKIVMTAFQNGSESDRQLFQHRYQDLPVAARPNCLTDEMCFTNGLKQDEQDFPTFQLYLLNTVMLHLKKITKDAVELENNDAEREPVAMRTLSVEQQQRGWSPSAFSATSAKNFQQRKIHKKRRASLGSFNGSMSSKVARFADTTLESREGSRADDPILLEDDPSFGTVPKPDFDDTTVMFLQIQIHGDELHLEYTQTTTELLDRIMHESRHALSSALCVSEAAGIRPDKPARQLSVYQRGSDGRLARITSHSEMISAMKLAYHKWQSWLPDEGLIFFALHKHEHLSLVPERYLRLTN